MLDDVIKTVVGVGVVCLIGFYAVQNRDTLYAAAGLDLRAAENQHSVDRQAKRKPQIQSVTTAPQTTSTGGKVRIPKNPRDGQFWTDGQVNNRSVKFLIDTGASAIALTPEDARRSGINPRRLDYDIRINTANGEGRAASVTLDSVRIGNIRVKNVEAMVVEDGLSVSLLGMTYLGQIEKIEVTPEMMILDN